MQKIVISALVAAAVGGPAIAGEIESACLAASGAGNRALCGCIQSVANRTLTRSDQRTAAKLFRDPDKAQTMRQSDSRSSSAFWDRYKNFGATAQAFCSTG